MAGLRAIQLTTIHNSNNLHFGAGPNDLSVLPDIHYKIYMYQDHLPECHIPTLISPNIPLAEFHMSEAEREKYIAK